MITQDKKHWYDGWFYDKFIAPNQDRMFNIISSVIEKDSSVVDIGCGTGRFCFHVSAKCKDVTGIDLSSTNINVANSNLSKTGLTNISFIHGNANTMAGMLDKKFDYAVITYMIHELDITERGNVIKKARAIADKIIIGDYIVPQPKNFLGLLNIVVEFIAGRDHYKNFKSFQKEGGLLKLAGSNGLRIIREVQNNPDSSHIVLLD